MLGAQPSENVRRRGPSELATIRSQTCLVYIKFASCKGGFWRNLLRLKSDGSWTPQSSFLHTHRIVRVSIATAGLYRSAAEKKTASPKKIKAKTSTNHPNATFVSSTAFEGFFGS